MDGIQTTVRKRAAIVTTAKNVIAAGKAIESASIPAIGAPTTIPAETPMNT